MGCKELATRYSQKMKSQGLSNRLFGTENARQDDVLGFLVSLGLLPLLLLLPGSRQVH